MRSPHILIGNYTDDVIKKRFSSRHIFPAPEIPEFSKTCLSLSILLGFHYEAFLHVLLAKKEKFKPDNEYKLASDFYKQVQILKKLPQDNKAKGLLKAKWIDIFSDTNLSPNGPFELKACVDTLSQYFGINTYVINSKDCKIYYRYPKKHNKSRPTIFLLLTNNEHVDLILDRFKVFPASPCIFCSQIVKRHDRHRCYSKEICFVCNKYKIDLMNNDKIPFRTIKNKTSFCIKDKDTDIICRECNLSCRSQKCFKAHKGVGQCARKRKCAMCKKVYLRHYEHDCNMKFCIRCKVNYDANKAHFCRMMPQKKINEICGLAIYDFETVQEENFNSCFECFYKEKDYLLATHKTRAKLCKEERKLLLCEKHENSDLNTKFFQGVNFISVLIENQHGKFTLIEFANPDLAYEGDMLTTPDYLVIPETNYYLKSKYGQPIDRCKYQKRKYKRDITSSENEFPILMNQRGGAENSQAIYIGKETNPEDFEYIKKNFSALEKFLIFFINEQFRNTTFLGKN